MTTFNTRVTFDHVRNTEAGFVAANPILGYGVIGLETDSGRAKIGDGTTAWNSLVYFTGEIDWAGITDKPSTFTPAAHQHIVGDVTGLQAALDGKQAAGAYATLVEGKVPSEQLPPIVTTWDGLTGKPSTFPPSSHGHAVADVTGLQAALDSKQASGSYAAASHTHTASAITDFSAAVAAVSPPASWDTLTGKPSTFPPSSHNHDDRYYTESETDTLLAGKQAAGSYVITTDSRLSDAREWSASTVSQVEAEAGTSTDRKAFTPLRVFQAIAAWWAGSAAKTKLDGISSGATANQTDAYLLDRSHHTGTQTASTISDFTVTASAAAPVQSVAGRTGTVTLTKGDVGLGNVDNTSDANKPVSTAQAAADAAVAAAAASDATTKANAAQAYAIQRGNHTGTQAISTVSGLQDALDSKQASGSYATLDGGGKVPAAQLPSYVDDVLEYANLAAFPASGETGKIYTDLATNKIYRWSGSTYIEVSPGPGSTDSVAEGSVNLYYTNARASAAAPVQSVAGRTGTVALAKGDVGLSDVDNTSDANKPVSTAQAAADAAVASAAASDATSKANAAQAYAVQRANHTGTQTASTISDFNTAASAAAPVQSVAGRTGNVTIAAGDVSGLGSLATASSVAYGDLTGTPSSFAPSAHKSSHATGGSDALSPADIGASAEGHAHSAADTTSGTFDIARLPVGTTSTTVCVGNDARLSDARTPTAHASTHGVSGSDPITVAASQVSGLATVATSGSYTDLSNTPSIPSAYTLPTASATVLGGVKIGSGISIDGSGVISASAGYTLPNATTSTLGGVIVGTGLGVTTGTISVTYGTSSGTACQGNDSRLSDARTPTSHASSHGSGGSDAITIAASQIGSGTIATARLPSSLVQSSNTTTTVSNTTAETNLFSYSQAASASTCQHRIIVGGTYKNVPGSSSTLTLRFKIGSTTVLVSDAMNLANSGDAGRWRAAIEINMVGSSASQRVVAFVAGTRSATATWTTISQFIANGYGVATEDMSTAKTVALTCQWSQASTNTFITCDTLVVQEVL